MLVRRSPFHNRWRTKSLSEQPVDQSSPDIPTVPKHDAPSPPKIPTESRLPYKQPPEAGAVPATPKATTQTANIPEWRQPIDTGELAKARWEPHGEAQGNKGKNPAHTVTLPSGRKLFAKTATRKMHEGMFYKKPVFPDWHSAADHSAEMTSNKILAAVGYPLAPSVAEYNREGKKHLIQSILPGTQGGVMLREAVGLPPDADNMELFRKLNKGKTRDKIKNHQAIADAIRNIDRRSLGSAVFANDLTYAGDRHFNNHLFGEGQVAPIDFGYSVWPRWETDKFWHQTPNPFKFYGQFDEREWGEVPVPRNLVENAVANKENVLGLVRGHVQLHNPWFGPYAGREALANYKDKLWKFQEALWARKQGDLNLSDLRIGGELSNPAFPNRRKLPTR